MFIFALGGVFCALFIGVLFVGVLIGAVILRLVARHVVQVELRFAYACVVVFFTAAVSMALSPIAYLILGFRMEDHFIWAPLIADCAALPLVFPVVAAMYGWMIKHDYPNTGKRIGWLNGAKLAGVMFLVRMAFSLIFVGLNVALT